MSLGMQKEIEILALEELAITSGSLVLARSRVVKAPGWQLGPLPAFSELSAGKRATTYVLFQKGEKKRERKDCCKSGVVFVLLWNCSLSTVLAASCLCSSSAKLGSATRTISVNTL